MQAPTNDMPEKYKYICLTLDAVVEGKREETERLRNRGLEIPDLKKFKASRRVRGYKWSTAGSWSCNVSFLESVFALAGDAYFVADYSKRYTHARRCVSSYTVYSTGQGLIVSNRGGGNLDTIPPPVHTLLEIRKY